MKLRVGQSNSSFVDNGYFYLLFDYKTTSSFVTYYQSILIFGDGDKGIPIYEENAKEIFDKVQKL